ncbi:MAG: YaeQ family protein [Casimicrobiaceae bacterium]
MALKATICKVMLSVADIDRGYYRDHELTIARHPSETDERMMVRLLAFALHADEALEFGRGLSTEDEPDVWRRDLTGVILQWIEVGLPDEREVRKACGRAREVQVLAYGGRAVDLWWQGVRDKFERQERLAVVEVPIEASRALAQLAARSMRLQVTIQEGHVFVSDGATSIPVELRALQALTHAPERGRKV